jgi:RimJ/RimL family protein N-acetyltransferase
LIEISANQKTPALKAYFDPRDPAGLRCIAVLEGIRPGKIFTDSPETPTWAVVWEGVFNALYPAGEVDLSALSALIQRFRQERMLFIGLWPNNPLWKSIHPECDQESRVLDYYDRLRDGRLQKYIDQLPPGTELRPVDENLIERSINRDLHHSGYSSTEEAEADLIGFFLMKDNEVLCEALAGVEVLGTREMGIDTREPYRQRGYATITCARLIQYCEQQGLQTYWNCNKFNVASVALARKLGYQTEKEYRLLIWEKK